jgi:hypothetical protein
MFETTKELIEKFIAALITAFIMVLISPFIIFWVSYIGGYFVKWLIGNILIQGLALFGIALPLEKIPLACGTIGFIASYFKQTVSANASTK